MPWACTVCTVINDVDAYLCCEVCGSARESPTRPDREEPRRGRPRVSEEAAPERRLDLRPALASAPATRHEKQLLLLRHAEGRHDAAIRGRRDWRALLREPALKDALLTPAGEAQAKALNAKLRANASFVPPELIVVSTLSRTIQTAALAFEGLDGDAKPYLSTELARERIAYNECDHRRTRSELQATWGPDTVDFSGVAEDDSLWTERKEVEPDEMNATLCTERSREFLEFLMERPERRIAVVSHRVFLAHLLRPYPNVGGTFENAEIRVYRLSRVP